MAKLRVRLPLFASGSVAEGPARAGISAIVRSAIACERAHESGIDSELCPVPERQAIANDLNAPRIMDGHIDVHGGERNVAADACPGLLADTSDGAFEGKGSRGEHTRHQMWSRQLGGLHTHQVRRGKGKKKAAAWAEIKGQAQAPQEQDTEVRSGDDNILTRWQDHECSGRVRSSLREQQGAGRRGQVSKVRLERALVASMGGSALPAAEEVGRFILLGRGAGRGGHGLIPLWNRSHFGSSAIGSSAIVQKGVAGQLRGMVVLTPVLAAGLRWLVEAAGHAVPAAAQLPTGCREAAMHALLTCAVAPPRYFTPGWGPCSHCWGWLCVGLLFFLPASELSGPCADPSPGRLRATLSKACGLQGAVQGTTLRGCRSAAAVLRQHWLCRQGAGRGDLLQRHGLPQRRAGPTSGR